MANEVERQEFIFGQAAQITRLEVIAERYQEGAGTVFVRRQ